MKRFSYGMKITVPDDFDSTLERVTKALQDNGFGVLTEIDVKKTLKAKLDEDFKGYMILGACNPKLAFQALTAEEDIGLLLPCNVIVYEAAEGTTVGVIDPAIVSTLTSNDVLDDIARRASELLISALAQVGGSKVG